ncbi:MAG: general secretion pathway protein GspK [Synergistaceae bacterium]|jgi:hypothetical protein|nr:general secretion pathway protein GspK [Synergistaceae bacterium]
MGVVLISCAASFAWFTRLQIRSALREKVSLENRSMAQVLTRSIISGIKSDALFSYDSPLLPWFKPFFVPVGDTVWVVQVVPLNDKIPIRSVFLPDGNTLRNELRRVWENLWEKLEKREMNVPLLDFMDKDAKPRMGGAERETHINRYPVDISELLILEGMTPELLYGSREKSGAADYCTLWSDGKINLNVAPIHVLEILPGLDRTLAEKIVEFREREPLKKIADLRDIPGFPPRAVTGLTNLVDFRSQYFMIKIEMLEDLGGGTSFNIIFDKSAGRVVRWEEI